MMMGGRKRNKEEGMGGEGRERDDIGGGVCSQGMEKVKERNRTGVGDT